MIFVGILLAAALWDAYGPVVAAKAQAAALTTKQVSQMAAVQMQETAAAAGGMGVQAARQGQAAAVAASGR